MKKRSFSLAMVLAAALVGGCVGAGVTHVGTVQAADRATGDQAITVFVDATIGFRKDSFAHKLSESHADYAAKGYTVRDVSLYDENGDMEGAFVTYVRD